MKRVDRMVFLVLASIVLVVPLAGQVNDSRDDAYPEWIRMSHEERMTYACAALVGATFALTMLYVRSGDSKGLEGALRMLPLGMTNLQMVFLVNRVYEIQRFRVVPFIGIMLDPGRWIKEVGGLNGSS